MMSNTFFGTNAYNKGCNNNHDENALTLIFFPNSYGYFMGCNCYNLDGYHLTLLKR